MCAMGLCILLLFAGGAAMVAQADQAMPAAPGTPPGTYTASPAGAGSPAVQPPSSVAGSALSGISDLSLSWSGYFQALAVVCFVLALLWALLWFVKRHGKGGFLGGSSALRIESRLDLGPKKWIMVIRYMDRRVLVGLTDENISLLANMPAENGAMENGGSGQAKAAASDTGGAVTADSVAQPGDHSADQLFASLLHGSKDERNAAK